MRRIRSKYSFSDKHRALNKRVNRRSAAQSRYRRLHVEVLEDRRLLAATVLSTLPLGGAHAAPADTDIQTTFDMSLQAGSVTDQAFVAHASQSTGQLLDSLGNITSLTASGDTVTLDPSFDFKPGELIQVTATDGILDGTATPVDPYVWQFRTSVTEGTGVFADAGQLLGNFSSAAVSLADLDEDGDLDAFVATYGLANRVWTNDGLGTFTDSGQLLGSSKSRSVSLGDLDGDGDLDAFVANEGQANRVWNNDGSGTFIDSGQILGNSSSFKVSLGDLDGDGDLDAYVANFFGQANLVWTNDGTGTFVDSGQILGTSTSSSVSLGDLDGDGDLDAFVANGGQANRVWKNDGTGTFIDSGQLLGDSFSIDVSLGDLDADGDLDAFLANADQANRIWTNGSSGTFTDSGQMLGSSNSRSVSLGDLDGDGDLDAYVANLNQPNLVWTNDGSATLSDSGQALGSSSSQGLTLGDLEGDGDLDAFVANSGQITTWINTDPEVVVAIAADPSTISEEGGATITFTFDRSGSTTEPLAVNFEVTGDALFGTDYTISGETTFTTTAGSVTIPAGLTTADIIVSSMDDSELEYAEKILLTLIDGLDYVAASTASATGTIAASDTIADYGDAPVPYPVLLAEQGAVHVPTGPTLGSDRDVEFDGVHSIGADIDDIIGIDDEDGVQFGVSPIQVGQLDATVTVDVQGGPAQLDAWIDFNGDGSWGGPGEQIFDNVAVADGSNALFFDVPSWAVDGNTYARFRLSTAGNLGIGGIAADGEVEDHLITIAKPAAASGFFSDTDLIHGYGSRSNGIFVADIDGDGKMDVLSTSDRNNTITLHKGNGDQRFTTELITSTAIFPADVIAADLDSDGDLDIISTSRIGDTIAWYENPNDTDFLILDALTPTVTQKTALIDFGSGTETIAGDGSVLDRASTLGNAFGGIGIDVGLENVAVEFNGFIEIIAAGDYEFTLRSDDGNILFIDGDVIAADTLSHAIRNVSGTVHLTPGLHELKVGFYEALENAGLQLSYSGPDTGGDRQIVPTAALYDQSQTPGGLDGSFFDLSTPANSDLLSQYMRHSISTSASSPWSVFAADMDGDGDTDILSASSGDDTIALYLNDGTGIFSEQIITDSVEGARRVFASDIDSDGDMDVLSASSIDDTIAWYRNDGGLVFTPITITSTADGAWDVFAVDIDNDGDIDVLSASSDDDTITLFINDGGETFTPQTITDTADGARSVYAADIDGDGEMDILSASFSDDTIAWYRNDGSLTFTPITISSTVEGAAAVIAADLDSDGDIDVISSARNAVSWHKALESIVGVSVSPNTVSEAGATDLVYTFSRNGVVTEPLTVSFAIAGSAVLANDYTISGADTFGATEGTVTIPAGLASIDVILTSVDDGLIELDETVSLSVLVGTNYGADITATAIGTITSDEFGGDFADSPAPYPTRLAENGAGHSRSDSNDPILGSIRDDEVDGQPSAEANSDDTLGIDDEDGIDFGLVEHQVGQLDASITVNVQNGPARLDAWIDFNSDGSWGGLGEQVFDNVPVATGPNLLQFDVPSLAIAGETFARFRISTAGNLGIVGIAPDGEVEDHVVTISGPTAASGFFGSQQVLDISEAADVAADTGDLDGDGDIDLVTGDDGIFWLENLGQGAFAPSVEIVSFGAAIEVRSLTLNDVDGDGDLDILSASIQDNRLSWHENLGGGIFGLHVISTDQDADSVTAGDLDRDGDVDVILASSSEGRDPGKVTWFENDGNQDFVPHIVGIDAIGATDVSVADINGDGHLDILVAAKGANDILWYENDGQQQFTSQVVTDSAFGVESVVPVDMDGDGDLDVLAALRVGSNKVVWYRNDALNFVEQIVASNVVGPWSAEAADIDGDGDLDVVAPADAASEVNLYVNDGNQVFTERNIVSGENSPETVLISDIDGDGDLDVISLSTGSNRTAWYENLTNIPGDFEPDGDVDGDDLSLWQSSFGVNANADADEDGDSDGADFLAWQRNFGTITVSASVSSQEVKTASSASEANSFETIKAAPLVFSQPLESVTGQEKVEIDHVDQVMHQPFWFGPNVFTASDGARYHRSVLRTAIVDVALEHIDSGSELLSHRQSGDLNLDSHTIADARPSYDRVFTRGNVSSIDSVFESIGLDDDQIWWMALRRVVTIRKA